MLFINRFKRRTMWIFSTVGILLTYSGLTAACATYASNASPDAGRAAVAMIFLYSAFYDQGASSRLLFSLQKTDFFFFVAWSILFYSYVLEILPYHQRTKGMSICLLVDYGSSSSSSSPFLVLLSFLPILPLFSHPIIASPLLACITALHVMVSSGSSMNLD